MLMLFTTLGRAAGGFRHASRPFRTLTPIAYRTLFYPSAPPPTSDSPIDREFPPETRDHLSQEQFDRVRDFGASSFPREDFHGLIDKPNTPKTGPSTPGERWEQGSVRFTDIQRQSPPGKHAGRTVEVRPGVDVAQAYFKLQAILRNNNVRKELKLAERHEKKGEKRRRLRSERWRRKFADEVRKKVKLVTEIRLRDRMWGARH